MCVYPRFSPNVIKKRNEGQFEESYSGEISFAFKTVLLYHMLYILERTVVGVTFFFLQISRLD